MPAAEENQVDNNIQYITYIKIILDQITIQ